MSLRVFFFCSWSIFSSVYGNMHPKWSFCLLLSDHLWMDTPVFKRARISQNALARLRILKETKSRPVPVSTCMQALTYCTSSRFCSTWLWDASKVYSWNTVWICSITFQVNSDPFNPNLKVHFSLRGNFINKQKKTEVVHVGNLVEIWRLIQLACWHMWRPRCHLEQSLNVCLFSWLHTGFFLSFPVF